MKPIDFGISDIPSDFRLESYDVCATWGVEEWRDALTHRSLLHLFSRLPVEDLDDDPEFISVEYLRECALGYLIDPFPVIGEEDRIYRAKSAAPSIRDLTGSDFYLGFYKLDESGYETPSALAKKVAKRTGILDVQDVEGNQIEIEATYAMAKLDLTPAWQIYRDASGSDDKFWIEVELGESDEELIKEFKRWLKRTRQSAGIPKIPKRFDKSDFMDWHSKRLLPYLDLTLWSWAHGGSLSPSVLGSALFPDEVTRSPMRDVEPMIRRTTALHAGRLISWQVVNTLDVQAREQTQKQ
ncbi:DUF6387 family protein [Paraburkholderia nemoris]|uniref:DUF6387 family protein n=1 Tax=Paraburkholderia nemoris TaxID=2793076 RepID=UPI0038BC09A8